MPLPTEVYEKAAAGSYTLSEVLRMEQIDELARLDPAQLLGQLSEMSAEKSADMVNPGSLALAGGLVGGAIGAARAPKGKRLESGAVGVAAGAGTGFVAGKLRDQALANRALSSFHSGSPAAYDEIRKGLRAAKGKVAMGPVVSAAREWLKTPAGRTVGGAAAGGLMGGAGGVATGYMAGGDKEQVGKAMRRGAAVGAVTGGLHALNPEVFPMGKGVKKTAAVGRHLRVGAKTVAGGIAGGMAGGLAGLHAGETVYIPGSGTQGGRGMALGALAGALAAGAGVNRRANLAEDRDAKTAAEPWDAARVKDVALQAAIHGGVGLGLGGAGVLAHRALSGVADKLTAGRDRRRILSVHPSIARENSPQQVDLAFGSLRRFAPHLTKDPLAGGNALGTILRSRDPLDPSAPPRVSGATVAADLGSKVLAPKSEAESAITSAMMSGAQGAMGAAHQRSMETGVKQPHAERMEARRDAMQRDRDSDIQASRRNATHANILRDYLVKHHGYHPDAINNLLK